jgi:hypothetical protein
MDAESLDDFWRRKVEDAQRRFSADRNVETCAEFRRLVGLFTELVLRGQLPPPLE